MSLGSAQPLWPGAPACPCGCGAEGLKLQVRHDGHLVGCTCAVCRGRRNRFRGRRAQRNAHQMLGGKGFSPLHEEAGRTYSVEHQIEMKQGKQIPAFFRRFLGLEWTRRAFEQAERAIPEGVVAYPTIYMEPPEGGAYLVTKLPPPRRPR